MKKVAILTDFVNHQPPYSLCAVVKAQVDMLLHGGYIPTVITRKGWRDDEIYKGANVVVVDPGETGSNENDSDRNFAN